MITKQCSKCNTDYPIETFDLVVRKGRNPYRKSICNACKNEQIRKNRAAANEKKRQEGYAHEARSCPCDTCPNRVGCVIFCNDFQKYLDSK